jgi:site-specific recombinase XerD
MILEPDQMRKLLDSIPVTREVRLARKRGGGVRVEADVKGLRDRAIIAIMAYTFARVTAVLKLKRGDYGLQGKRARLRLLEKGTKEKLVWLHHEAEQYLDAYLEAASIHEAAELHSDEGRSGTHACSSQHHASAGVRNGRTGAGI